MQGPTHFLAGMVLRELFRWRYYRFFAVFFTVILAFLSHGLLDKIAKATYHPPNSMFTDFFWLAFHTAVCLVALVLLYLFGKRYWWAMLVAILPDVDWLVLHLADALGKEVMFYSTPHLHNTLYWILEHTIPFCNLDSLPDWRYIPAACLLEILFCALLWFSYRALVSRRRNIHF